MILLIASVLAHRAHGDISVIDGRGKPVTLQSPPNRIVSLSPGTTEMLFSIGLKGRIVADTTYCDFPAEAKSLPKIGDVTISAERVLAQRPDLIVASASANRTAIQTLERLGLKVFAIDPATFEGTYLALTKLGAITGQAPQAYTVVRKMKARVSALKSDVRIPKSDLPKVLWVVQMDPMVVVGSRNFMDDLIKLAGAHNAGTSSGSGWPSMAPESVLAMRPDVIVTGKETATRLHTRSGWKTVPAVAHGRIVSLGTDTAVRPGPRLVDALAMLIDAIHGAKGP